MSGSGKVALSLATAGGQMLVQDQAFASSDLVFELQRCAQAVLGKPVHALLAPPPLSSELDVGQSIQSSGLSDGAVVTVLMFDHEEQYDAKEGGRLGSPRGKICLNGDGSFHGQVSDVDYDGTETNGIEFVGRGRWERSEHDKLTLAWEEQVEKSITYDNDYGKEDPGKPLGGQSLSVPCGGPIKWHGYTFHKK
eukprot:TRINITY_DN49264_c0_g1_i1.p1 TRINITY_DN49264_c0_g1~~TRINITY_DN49264_c0_g1_i1.p1  ORF type:complete len:194 (+),score=27.77 TRINITY_DN49264_c0_g1_i1:27-608(+)